MKMRKLTIALLVAAAVACTKSDNLQSNIPEGYGTVMFDANPVSELTTRAAEDADVYYLTNKEGYYPAGATNFVVKDMDIELPTIGENSNMKLTIKSLVESNPYIWPNAESDNPDMDNPEDTTVGGYNDMAMQRYLLQGRNAYMAEVTWGDADYEGPITADVKPYFYGRAKFDVVARQNWEIALNPVLGNSIVRVLFTENFKKYFENGAEFTIKTKLKAEGEAEATDQSTFKVVYAEEISNTLPEGTYIESTPFFVKNGKGRSFSITGWAKKQNPTATIEGETVEFRDIVPLSCAGIQGIDIEASTESLIYTYYPKMYTFLLTVSAGSVKVGVALNSLPEEADVDKWITIVDSDVEINDDAVVDGNN